MLRSFLPAIFVIFLACTFVSADDYLLRIETIGFRDQQQREKEPTKETLESIELVTRVNQPFYGNFKMGAAKISIHGILEPTKDGGFEIRFTYRRSKYSGTTESTEISSTFRIELQQAVELGRSDKIIDTPNGRVTSSKTRSVLSLEKFDPDGN